MRTDYHIVPIDDFREHEPETTCWCRPTQHDDESGVWLHHAMDGREAYESGERKLS